MSLDFQPTDDRIEIHRNGEKIGAIIPGPDARIGLYGNESFDWKEWQRIGTEFGRVVRKASADARERKRQKLLEE